MRIGIVSDLHHDRAAPADRRWINRFETEAVPSRLQAALTGFRAAEVDVTVLLGDLTHHGDAASLAEVLGWTRDVIDGPLAAVDGNHDAAASDGTFADGLRRHHMLDPAQDAWVHDGIALTGVAVMPVDPTCDHWRVRSSTGPTTAGGTTVVASHFPLLSQQARLEAAGLPYSGDLDDRADLLAAVAATGRPVLAITGHIHARCAEVHGPVLQLSVGALVEPPFDATIVEITDGAHPRVTRSTRRLGPKAPVDPVFANAGRRWTWTGTGWRGA